MAEKSYKKYVFLAVTVVAIFVAFYAGTIYGSIEKLPKPIQGIINQDFGKPKEFDFSLFWKTWDILHQKYVDPSKLTDANLLYGAVAGMVKGAGDPYTVFFPPQEATSFTQEVQGQFGGIGAEIGLKNDIITVIAPLEGTPAQRAGILAGDEILKINNESTDGLTVEKAVNKIRGDVGTNVTLSILHSNSSAKTKDITITREIINIPIVKLENINNNKIAHLSFYSFTATAPAEFQKAASQILTSNAKGIILDLRNNPGGYLEVAVDIAGWFSNTGDLVAIEDYGHGKTTEFRTSGLGALKNYPMVVLVNQGSASAAEILSGALRDNKDVKLVGTRTFGKGSVQELTNLDNGSAIKITIAKWLTPKGISISEKGLDPDYKVELTDEDITAKKDPQLDKAVEVLSGLIK